MSDQCASRLVARFRGRLGTFALDAGFEAPMRGAIALFGPSGCGKTTVLRCIAGLQRLPHGHLTVDGEVWQDGAGFRQPFERAVGYVFQEASLFPHLSVRRNLLYGHRRALRRGAAEATRFDEVVDLLGIAPLLERAPLRLSGGERQRVAIGRALLAQPRLLLMDEPLAGLDRFSKDEILPYLEALHERLSIPILYVSHDIAEVERLADHLVLMDRGRVAASGPLRDLQTDPRLPIARLPEASTVLDATVTGYDAGYDLTTFGVDGGALLVPGRHGAGGTPQRLQVAAAEVSLARRPLGASTILNNLAARVVAAEQQGAALVTVVVRLGVAGQGARLLARVTRRSWDGLGARSGDLVYAQVKSVALVGGGGRARRQGDAGRCFEPHAQTAPAQQAPLAVAPRQMAGSGRGPHRQGADDAWPD